MKDRLNMKEKYKVGKWYFLFLMISFFKKLHSKLPAISIFKIWFLLLDMLIFSGPSSIMSSE